LNPPEAGGIGLGARDEVYLRENIPKVSLVASGYGRREQFRVAVAHQEGALTRIRGVVFRLRATSRIAEQ
jgi:hypothetical protein